MAQEEQYASTESSTATNLDVTVHEGDLSLEAAQELQNHMSIAVDFETGCTNFAHKENPDGYCKEGCALDPEKGALQQIQICGPDKKVHIVRIRMYPYPYNLLELLEKIPIKIVHYTYFELGWDLQQLNMKVVGQWLCTKIANQIFYPDNKHSLNNLVQDHLGIEILKNDELWKWGWAQLELSSRQIEYSAHDVIHLHDLFNLFLYKNESPTSLDNWYKWSAIQVELCKLERKTGISRKVLGRI